MKRVDCFAFKVDNFLTAVQYINRKFKKLGITRGVKFKRFSRYEFNLVKVTPISPAECD